MTRPREAGFTLIEIIVSLALAALVLVGTLGFMNAQGRSHRDSMELQTMQMGLRAGLERIVRDARSASAGFNVGTISLQDSAVVTANPGVAALPAVWLGHTVPRGTNTPNHGVGGADELNMIFADGRGITNTTRAGTGVVSQSGTPQNIDVMDVRGFVGAASFPDNFVIISDVSNAGSAGANAILARVTTVTPAAPPNVGGTLTIGAMSATNPFPVASFQGGSLIMTASAVTYRVRTDVFGTNEPALVMERGAPLGLSGLPAPDPLATQIEDLQVALGFDGLLGATADRYITEGVAPSGVPAAANDDEWAYNFPGDTLTGAIATLRTVRVTLVARSVNPRAVGVGPLTVEDHVPATGPNYLRRRLTGVASVRNLAF